MKEYDTIIIGGGHAGIEAALASHRLGANTLLITQNADHIGQMSCNPAIGGIAKGHVVREIDALGGEMGQNADATSLQFRMLNSSKGPAVWSPRAQCDKILYQKRMKQELEKAKNIDIHQAEGLKFKVQKDKISAVETQFGDCFKAKTFVLCTGTFMRGLLHFGNKQFSGGRTGDNSAEQISLSLKNDLKLQLIRLKTGTPPRVLAKTIDFSQMQTQEGEDKGKFSFWESDKTYQSIARKNIPQLPCYIIHTNEKTKAVVEKNLHKSPMYNGTIKAIGTRYCPSIEDKIHRFPDKLAHQIYLEPEGIYTDEYYLNGISTSLPIDIQRLIVRSLTGLEKAEIVRYAYAVEYDVIAPHQITQELALKKFSNLFVAGQINGTSGYEEAAGQGIIAGTNAALKASGKNSSIVLGRDQAYIGVMIDDLITKDISEPYRLFTSRAEYRLLLRQDNADRRLSPIAYQAGLLSYKKYKKVLDKEKAIQKEKERLASVKLEGKSLWQHLSNKKNSYKKLTGNPEKLSEEIIEQIEIDARYEAYTKREMGLVERIKKMEHWIIPSNIDYKEIKGLRNEAKFKLQRFGPKNLAQAARIDGVTPAELSLLQVHIKRITDTKVLT